MVLPPAALAEDGVAVKATLTATGRASIVGTDSARTHTSPPNDRTRDARISAFTVLSISFSATTSV